MRNKSVIIGLAVMLSIGMGYLYISSGNASENSSTNSAASSDPSQPSEGVKVGQIAPDFEFYPLNGKRVNLSQFRGQPVIISFVQTEGCAPCAIEAQNINKVQESAKLHVMQIGIAPETAEDMKAFKDALGRPEWIMGFDRELVIAKQYEVRNLDTTVLVDANGKIIYRDEGAPAQPAALLAALKQ